MVYLKNKQWLDNDTLKLIKRREKIINELQDIEMKLDIIKGVSCQPIQTQIQGK